MRTIAPPPATAPEFLLYKKSWSSPGPAKVAVLATFADQRYCQMARKSAETARFGRIPQRKTRFSGM
jgi:hypothetical protein